MRDLHTEFVHRKIEKPKKWLAYLVCLAFRFISKRRNVEFVYDDSYIDIKNEQMIYLCQHRSHEDYIYTLAGLKRFDVHYLCGYQNIFLPIVYTLFKNLGVIAKMLYQPDMRAIMQLMSAVKQGGSIVLFPEGIQSTSGSTHPINPATMKLLMKLKLPVTLVSLKGAYFTRNRYSTDIKKGKITVRFSKLFGAEDFETFTSEELYSKLIDSFQYNEFTEHQGEKVAFYGKKPNIYGLDNIIYKCPDCNSEFQFTVDGNQMRCNHCDFAVSMDEYYDLASVKGDLPFSDIDRWYKWQRGIVAKQVQDDTFSMSAKVKIGRINTRKLTSNYSLQYYGEGLLTLNNQGLRYCGTRDGEEVDVFFQAKQVFSLTMSLQHDFDLYYDGVYYNFKLLEKEKEMAKWMLAAEEIHNLHDPVWRTASAEVYHA